MKDGDLAAAVQAGTASHGEPPVIAQQAGAIREGEPPLVAVIANAEQGPPPLRTVTDRRAMVTELMRAHGEAVVGFCLRVVHARTVAEDVAQQVFLEAYRDLDRFEGRSSALAWLFGIAGHRCLDALRTQRRRANLIENNEQAVLDFEDPGPGQLEHVDLVGLTAALEACLQRLSPNVRATVLLRFYTGSTYEELAMPLAATADTLQVRVARALPILRRCLEKKGWTGE